LRELLPHSEMVLASTAAELATWTDRSVSFLDAVDGTDRG